LPPTLSPEQTLRRLFLTLFLRGRGARGLQKDRAPKSVGTKLAGTLAVYALFGCFGLAMFGHSVFTQATYLHGMTLMFLGMFVASSAGEVLFNREEADILLHRPIEPRDLLWAKIGVLVQMSLWLAGAFNLPGLFVGMAARNGSWLFLPAHVASTIVQAFFCVSFVVLIYQLCLRWFGRERLDGLMTTAQVILVIVAVVGGQIVPNVIQRFDRRWDLSAEMWWVWLFPPAWFAGLDDAIAGSRNPVSWILAGVGLIITAAIACAVFGRLAKNYGSGLQMLSEGSSPGESAASGRSNRRWLSRLVEWPILRACLGDSVSRATFLLVVGYLMRDRDVKLRVYPGLAPLLVMPILLILPGRSGAGVFGVAFAGAYLGVAPLLAIGLLQYSQQWQAADVFRAAPLPGPAPLTRGLRRAVLLLIVMPLFVVYAVFAGVFTANLYHLALLLPGLIAVPIYALVPCLRGEAVPFSLPADEAKSASRGVKMIGAVMAALAIAGLSSLAWAQGWFLILLIGELLVVAVLHAALKAVAERARWTSLE
jgi:hypothetical protein